MIVISLIRVVVSLKIISARQSVKSMRRKSPLTNVDSIPGCLKREWNVTALCADQRIPSTLMVTMVSCVYVTETKLGCIATIRLTQLTY